MKIGITGSIASGKTTVSKILSLKSGPLFSADQVVKKLYKNTNFQRILIKEFNIKKKSNFKYLLKNKILKNKGDIKKLEKIIHPMVRREMKKFSVLNKKNKNLFYEVPLLIENKLMNLFDKIVFVKARKSLRLKRFKANGGDEKIFNMLNAKQLIDSKKIKFADYIIVNEKNLKILKKKLSAIIKLYA